jgi:hypothetical protein
MLNFIKNIYINIVAVIAGFWSSDLPPSYFASSVLCCSLHDLTILSATEVGVERPYLCHGVPRSCRMLNVLSSIIPFTLLLMWSTSVEEVSTPTPGAMRQSPSINRAYLCYIGLFTLLSLFPLYQLVIIGKSTYILISHLFSTLRTGTVLPALGNDTSLDMELKARETSSRLMPAVARYTTIDESRRFFRELADDACSLQRRCASS